MRGLANAMLRHFAEKLPVSRWQRDLSDSTVLRNLGVALGHSALAWRSALRGLERIEPDERAHVGGSRRALGSARGGDPDGHARAWHRRQPTKSSRSSRAGAPSGRRNLRDFVATLGLPDDARRRLEALTPAAYTGLAEALARAV